MGHYNRPGTRYYVTAATKAVLHGKPCTEDGVVGTAQKQKQPLSSAGIGGSPDPQVNIPVGEAFAIVCKGIVKVPFLTGAAKGDALYIIAATNVLTETAAGNLKFGRVVEIQGQRGTETGFMRVDLDMKDSIP
jgi:hypothetical protein